MRFFLRKFSPNFYFEVEKAKGKTKKDQLTKFQLPIMFTLPVVPV